MAIKVLTPEMARKSSRIWISKTHNVIVLDIPRKPSKIYGKVSDTKAYKMTPENLKVANRYK